MIMRFIMGLILVLLAITTGLIMGGAQLGIYTDWISLAILVTGSFAAVLMFHSPGEIKTAFVHAFANKADTTINYEPDIIFFTSLHKILTIVGIIGFLLGCVAMLPNLRSWEKIARGFGVAFLTIFYALIFQLLLTIPCKAMLEKKQSKQATMA